MNCIRNISYSRLYFLGSASRYTQVPIRQSTLNSLIYLGCNFLFLSCRFLVNSLTRLPRLNSFSQCYQLQYFTYLSQLYNSCSQRYSQSSVRRAIQLYTASASPLVAASLVLVILTCNSRLYLQRAQNGIIFILEFRLLL